MTAAIVLAGLFALGVWFSVIRERHNIAMSAIDPDYCQNYAPVFEVLKWWWRS